MLSRTLRSSRSAPSLRSSANGGQTQQALLHTSSPVTRPSPALMRSSQPSPLKGSPQKDITVAELKLELKSRGLKTTGRKQELVHRLSESPIQAGSKIRTKSSVPNLRSKSTLMTPPPVPKIPASLHSSPTRSSPQLKRYASTVDNIKLPDKPPMIKFERPAQSYDPIPILHYNQGNKPAPVQKSPLPATTPGTVRIISGGAGVDGAAHTPTAVSASESDSAHFADVNVPSKVSEAIKDNSTTAPDAIRASLRKVRDTWRSTAKTEKFVPEDREIPQRDKSFLYGLVGAGTLWGLFGGRGRR